MLQYVRDLLLEQTAATGHRSAINITSLQRQLPDEYIDDCDALSNGLLAYLKRYPQHFIVTQNPQKQWVVVPNQPRPHSQPVSQGGATPKKSSNARSVGYQPRPQLIDMDAPLIDKVKDAIPRGQYFPVFEVYVRLDPSARTQIRNEYETLNGFFHSALGKEHFCLTPDGVQVTQRNEDGSVAPPGANVRREQPSLPQEESDEVPLPPAPPAMGDGFGGSAAIPSAPPAPPPGAKPVVQPATHQKPKPPPAPRPNQGATLSTASPVNYEFSALPPPPSDCGPTTRLDKSIVTEGLTVESFVAYIPDFFTPVSEVLELLPGYTEEHLQHYLARSKAVQTIEVDGDAFIRLHGHYGQIDMEDCQTVANKRFPQFKPQLELAMPFANYLRAKHLKGPNGECEWVPLEKLLAAAPVDLVAKLPFQGAAAILFFGQLQHIFSICLEDGGTVCLADLSTIALNSLNTPCPSASNQLLKFIGSDRKDIDEVLQNASDATIEQIVSCYPMRVQSDEEKAMENDDPSAPSAAIPKRHEKRLMLVFRKYLEDHHPFFTVDGSVVMSTKVKSRTLLKDMPLEEQLEAAIQKGLKKDIRKIRRKLAVQQNPDHPLLDPERLAETVHGYLPQRRHVKFRIFLKSLPFEIVDMLPVNYMKFFRRFPEKFQIFEMHGANAHFIMRAGIPLPAGHLRSKYTADEIAMMLAGLMKKKTARNTAELLINLPEGARKQVLTEYNGLVRFVSLYPENFGVMRGTVDESEAKNVITLLSVPTPQETAGADDEEE